MIILDHAAICIERTANCIEAMGEATIPRPLTPRPNAAIPTIFITNTTSSINNTTYHHMVCHYQVTTQRIAVASRQHCMLTLTLTATLIATRLDSMLPNVTTSLGNIES